MFTSHCVQHLGSRAVPHAFHSSAAAHLSRLLSYVHSAPSSDSCEHACSTSYAAPQQLSSKARRQLATAPNCVQPGASPHDGRLPPLSLYGQVISSSVGFVKVALYDPCTKFVDGKLQLDDKQDATASNTPATASLPQTQLLCNIRSILRKLKKNILVGDHVCIGSIDWKLGRGTVEDIMPRTSEIVDPAIANVGHALLVFALANPPFEELQVSKFLVSMEASGLPFTLVLNKVDLVSEQEVEMRVEQVQSWGYEPLLVSCDTGLGLTQVSKVLSGRTSVVAGPSGAGKSSLINALRLGRHRPDQEPIDMRAAASLPLSLGLPPAVSEALSVQSCPQGSLQGPEPGSWEQAPDDSGDDEGLQEQPRAAAVAGEQAGSAPSFLTVGEMSRMGRGMHTTTTVTLIKLEEGGMLADTPGFSQPSLARIPSQDLASHFPDIRRILEEQPCRFSDCAHLLEPGCSINNNDELERYPHYVRMLLDLKEREESDVKIMQLAKQQREGNGKVKTGKGGKQRIEARLDPRRHRSSSRQQSRLGLLQSLDE